MSRIKLIFIAGPYSGNVNDNSDSALELCVEVSRVGAMPICPNAFKDPRFMQVQSYEFWIEATKEALARCDGVIFTHNFRTSSGAKGEELEAKKLGIPCFYNLKELQDFLNEQNKILSVNS